MGDIDHQHRGSLGLEIRFADLQVVFLHIELIDAVVDLGIADGLGKIYLFQLVAKTEGPGIRIELVTAAGFEGVVVALL